MHEELSLRALLLIGDTTLQFGRWLQKYTMACMVFDLVWIYLACGRFGIRMDGTRGMNSNSVR